MSDKLISALDQVRDFEEITVGKIVEGIESESIIVLCLVAILPFLQPIPIPGLSSILGLIILFQGLGLVFKGKPLLTKKMLGLKITHERFELIYNAAKKLNSFTSKISTFKHSVSNSKASRILCGIAIVLSAAFLSLPLPIPFSNFIPALSIFLICVGLLEEDIILIMTGLGITLTVIWMAVFSFHLIRDHLSTLLMN